MTRTIITDHPNGCRFAIQRDDPVGLGLGRIRNIDESKGFPFRIRVNQGSSPAFIGEVPKRFGVGCFVCVTGGIELLADVKGRDSVEKGRAFGGRDRRNRSREHR